MLDHECENAKIKQYGKYRPADVSAGFLGVGEGAVASRGDAVTLHEGLGEALTGLQLSRLGCGSETRHSCSRQVVHNP